MAFFKIDVELEWLGFALIYIFLTYIFYRKANRPPTFYCEQQCVWDKCVKFSDYFQLFRVRLYDTVHKLSDSDVADTNLLSSWKDHCKIMFYGLIDEFQSNGDVIKFVVDFAADLSNSRLFKVISDEAKRLTFKKSYSCLVSSI